MIAERIKSLLTSDMQAITYIGEFPATPSDVIVIMESGGRPDVYFGMQALYRPRIDIYVRHNSYVSGYALCEQIKSILTVNLSGVIISNDVAYEGRDKDNRNVWHITLQVFYQ